MYVLQDKDGIESYKYQMELEITVLSKISRAHEDKYCVISFLLGRQKENIDGSLKVGWE